MPAPSLKRRRGQRSQNRLWDQPLVRLLGLLLAIATALTLGLVTLLYSMSSSDTWRHKVVTVPHQLRGNEPEAVKVPHADSNGSVSQHSNPQSSSSSKDYPYPLVETPPDYDIAAEFAVLGGRRYAEYTSGVSPYAITDTLRQQSDAVARSRKTFVKRAMQFCWSEYAERALGADELLPESGEPSNNWGGQGITLVDALDTLWLMDMKDEFWKARDWVRDHLDHSRVTSVSVFETTIRDLGGLLAAYDWSGDKVFLTKAQDLGERLLHAFDNSPTGIPNGQVSLASGSSNNLAWTGGNALTAEFGTLQLENRYLSKAVGDPKFAHKTERVIEILNEISPANGLYPYALRNRPRGNTETLKDGVTLKPSFANDKITFGAMGDSLYEYFLKVWIQGGRKEPMYREMYDRSIEGMHNELLQTSTPTNLTYIADKNNGVLDHKMDHLVCFMGGLLALGAYTDPLGLESERAQRDLKTGKALTYTCYQMYARMNTGISPEFIQFYAGKDFQIGRGAPHYLLRPEAVESFFILNYLTGDPIYREWGWEVFQAIEKYCKTTHGYGSLGNVQNIHERPRNKQESFFLAETLKYLYLLQDPDTEVDILHKHVFNTEAHPLRVFTEF